MLEFSGRRPARFIRESSKIELPQQRPRRRRGSGSSHVLHSATHRVASSPAFANHCLDLFLGARSCRRARHVRRLRLLPRSRDVCDRRRRGVAALAQGGRGEPGPLRGWGREAVHLRQQWADDDSVVLHASRGDDGGSGHDAVLGATRARGCGASRCEAKLEAEDPREEA